MLCHEFIKMLVRCVPLYEAWVGALWQSAEKLSTCLHNLEWIPRFMVQHAMFILYVFLNGVFGPAKFQN